jgi:hypothetical protein
MHGIKALVAATAIGGALALAPTAVALAGQASQVEAECWRYWGSETAEWGAWGYYWGPPGTGSTRLSAILYYRDSTVLDTQYAENRGNTVLVKDHYYPVWGGHNFNVDAAAWTDGPNDAWKFDTCWIT